MNTLKTLVERRDHKVCLKVSKVTNILMMTKGWLKIILKSHEATNMVEKEYCSIDVIFNFWSPTVNASKERLDVVLVWFIF